MNLSPKQKKILIVAGIFTVVALVVSVALRNFGKIGVDVVVLPNDSTLKVDGVVTQPGRVYFSPGTHTLTATREHFSEVKRTFNTADLRSGEKIYLMPKPDSAEAEQWLIDNPEIQAEREAAGGEEAVFEQEATQEEYPITANLPYHTLDYTVNYSFNNQDKIVFEVVLNPVALPDDPGRAEEVQTLKSAALEWLRSQGVDSKKTPVVFTPDK